MKLLDVLSNGLELKKGDKINPFSYAKTLQEQMLKKVFSAQKIWEKRIQKKQCWSCGTLKASENENFCSFCGESQFEKCSYCSEQKIAKTEFCGNSGKK